MDINAIEDVELTTESNEPIYKSKDGQIVTHSQLLHSGYDKKSIDEGLNSKILSVIGNTQNHDQEYKSKDGQIVNTKQLLESGYPQSSIDKGILDGILTPLEKKNQLQTAITTSSENLPVGGSLSTTNIPTVPLDKEGKGLAAPQNPIDYSVNIFQLEDKGDDASRAQAKKYRDDLKAQGYDPDKLHDDFKDIDEKLFTQEGAAFSKDKLLQEYKENPQQYDKDVAQLKFLSLHAKAVSDLPTEEREKFQEIKIGGNTPEERRATNKEIVQRIKTYGGDYENDLLKNFATIVGQDYGEALESPDKLKQDPRSQFLNEYQLAAIQYLEDVNPKAANSYGAMMVDPSLIKKGSLEEAGYQEKASSLEQIGLQLYRSYLSTQEQSIADRAKNGEVSQADVNDYNNIQNKIKDVDNKIGEINVKYPLPADKEAKEAAMDLTNNSLSTWYTRPFLSLGKAIDNTLSGIYDFATEPFRNDKESNLYQLATMGKALGEETSTYLPKARTGLQNYDWKISKDIVPDYKKIMDNNSLSADEKTQKVYQLLQKNPDKFTRIPYKESKININPSSIYYSVVDLGASLLPYIGLETLTGGGATAGIARKLLSSFTSAAATGFHDNYVQAIREGSKNPYEQALVTTGIMSAAMAGAGTADMIKSMVGTKTAAGELISKLSNEEIEKTLEKIKNGTLKNKILDFGKSIGKDAAKSIAEGAKGGLKFESIMGAAKALDKKLKGEDVNVKDLAKEAALGVLNFTVFGGTMGIGKSAWKNVTDIQGGTLLNASENPSEYLTIAQKQLTEGKISKDEYNQIKNNIELASKVGENIKYVDDSGKELSEKKKAQLLVAKMQEAKLNEDAQGDIPAKLKENLDSQSLEIKNDIANIQKSEEAETDLENIPELKATIDNLKSVIKEGGEDAGQAQLDLDLIQKDPTAYYEKQKADYLKSVEGQDVSKEEIDNTTKAYDDLINKIKELKAAPKAEEVVITLAEKNEQEQIFEYNGKQYKVKGDSATTLEGDLVPIDLVDKIKAEGKLVEAKELPKDNQAEIEKLRADEQAELDSRIPNAEQYRVDGKVDRDKLTNEEDRKAFDEIYDKYDKLITPLLEGKEAATTSVEALKDVESTAKALEGKDISNLIKDLGIESNWDMIGEGDLFDKKSPEFRYTQRLLPGWNTANQRGEINPNSKLTYDIVRGRFGGLDDKEVVEAKDENGVVVGVIKLSSNGGIEHIAIAPEFRGKGVSDKLLKKLKENNPNLDLSKTKLRSKGFEKTFAKNIISEAYHKAKADGSNPKLVKAVEDLLGVSESIKQKTESEKEEEITPMEGEAEQPPFIEEGGRNVVTHSGLTEEGRQKLIAQRNKELKVTEKSKDEQGILDEIDKYNSLKEGRLGKLKPEGLGRLNKIRSKIAEFNEKHGTNYEFNQKSGKLVNEKFRAIKRKATEGREAEINESGKTIRERNSKTQQVFDDLLEQGAMPTGYREDGLRMSDAQLDATIQDILDGVPSRRANNYLDRLEKQIAKDDFDFSKGDDMPAHMRPQIKLNDVLDISKETMGEPMSEADLNNWLETESERTPENQEVYDNIDNLITDYETRNEPEGKIQPTEAGAKERVVEPAKPTAKEQGGGKQAEPKKPTTEEPKKPIGKFEEKARKVADKIKASELPSWLSIEDKDIKKSGVSADELKKLLADAVVKMGQLLDKGVEFSEAVKQSVKDLVNAYGEDKRDLVEKGFAEDYRKKIAEEPDTDATKMANAINDTFIEGKFGPNAVSDIISKLQDTSTKNIYESVKKKIQSGLIKTKDVVERILTTKNGSEEDQAVLMYDLADLKEKESALMNEMINTKDEAKKAQISRDILDIQADMQANALANRYLGRTASTIFRLRQLWVNREMDLATMEKQYMASKGISEMTPEQSQEVRDAYAKITELKAQVEKAKQEVDELIQKTENLQAENEKLKKLKEESNKKEKNDRGKKAEEKISESNKRIQEYKNNLRNLGGDLNTGVNPKVAIEIGKIAAEKFYQGVVKMDVLIKDILTDVKDIFPNWTELDVRKHLFPNLKDSNLYFTESKDYKSSEKELRDKIDQYKKLQSEYAKTIYEWQKNRRADLMEKRPWGEKIFDKIYQWQRFAILSYPATVAKLAAVVGHNILLKPIRFGLQKSIAKLSGAVSKNFADKMGVYGDPSLKALTKYYSEFIRNFSLANLKEQFSGLDTKEILYGDKFMYDEWAAGKGLLEMPGRAHGYIKAFVKNPEFQFAHEMLTGQALTRMAELGKKLENPNLSKEEKTKLQEEYDNNDVTNENVLQRINKLALEHGKDAILMGENTTANKFRNLTKGGGFWATALKTEAPVVKIPLNYIDRALLTKYGLMQALTGKSWGTETGKHPSIAKLIFKGTEGLTEAQGQALAKTIAYGTIGAALFALGYYNKNKVKMNDDGSIDFNGVHVSKNLIHLPEFESFFSGVETAQKFTNKEKELNWIESFLLSDIETLKKNPFLGMLEYGFTGSIVRALTDKRIKDDSKLKILQDASTQKLINLAVPGFLKQPAQWLDTQEGKGLHPMGTPIKRKPEGDWGDRFVQSLEMTIPGLRQKVPISAINIEDVYGDSKGIKLLKENDLDMPETPKLQNMKVNVDKEHPDGYMTEKEKDEFLKIWQKEIVSNLDDIATEMEKRNIKISEDDLKYARAAASKNASEYAHLEMERAHKYKRTMLKKVEQMKTEAIINAIIEKRSSQEEETTTENEE